jgi:lactate racemase
MIGTPGVTAVRALINEAATLIPADRLALCLVVASGTDTLHAAAFGTPEDAWAASAEISAETHVSYLDAPVRRVLSIMPAKYEDIWTAAKGFYKLEPIVADGGEVIIYAPHITQVSVMHPQITEIGYHCRDYFLGQWDRFKDQPWGDLAHSTHLRGQGTWDPDHGERDRVTVTLATGIPEEIVRSVNLNYLTPPKSTSPHTGQTSTPSSNRTLARSCTASGPRDPAPEEANQTVGNPPQPVWTASQGRHCGSASLRSQC